MKDEKLNIRIARVRELKPQCRFHRWTLARYSGEAVNISLSARYGEARSCDVLVLTLGAHYTTVRNQIVRPLIDYEVEICFLVDELDGMVSVESGEVLIPPRLLALTLGIGIGALRGMLAVRTADTFLSHYPLPVFEIGELVRQISPDGGVSKGKLPQIRIESPGYV